MREENSKFKSELDGARKMIEQLKMVKFLIKTYFKNFFRKTSLNDASFKTKQKKWIKK